MAPIVVPKTPRKAYNPNRKPSDLILKQIQHLEWALLPAAQRKPTQLRGGAVKTEAQAADYIALLTERMHLAYADAQAAPPDAGPLEPVELPSVPKAQRVPSAKKAAKPRAKSARKTAGTGATRPRKAATRRPARAKTRTSTRRRG